MKSYFVTILAVAAGLTAAAQGVEHSHNFQLNVGGGYHSYFYNPADGDLGASFGGLVEGQYQLMFNRHFGFGIGLQAACLQGRATYAFTDTRHTDTYPGTTLTGWDIDTRYDITERQHGILASVPVQLLFRAPWAGGAFQLGLGVTLDYIFNTRYTAEGVIARSGHCSEINQTIDADLTHDFMTVNDNQEGTYDFANKFNVGILADAGCTFNCSDAVAFYAGIYFNMGTMNYLAGNPASQEFFVAAGSTEAPYYTYSGTFNSDRTQKVVPMEAGIKLGLRFGGGKAAGSKAASANEAVAADASADADGMAREKAEAETPAEAETRDKVVEERLARVQEQMATRANAEAAARANAEAAARANAEAAARANAEAEARQAAREEAEFVAGFKSVAYFELGKDEPILDKANDEDWNRLKVAMDKYPGIKVTIVGHTDNVGDAASNRTLSQQRAEYVRTLLVKKGIRAPRIITVGKGETEPVADNGTPEGRAQNRRIEITVSK